LLNASESGRPLELWTTKWPDGDLPLICLKKKGGFASRLFLSQKGRGISAISGCYILLQKDGNVLLDL